jgi:ABC-type branched-subunit amino acid transport system ATPase component
MPKPILSVMDIVADYGEMTILNRTTFNVNPGTITPVIGPNGAGKSTVFKTIFWKLKARSGTIAPLMERISPTRRPGSCWRSGSAMFPRVATFS